MGVGRTVTGASVMVFSRVNYADGVIRTNVMAIRSEGDNNL